MSASDASNPPDPTIDGDRLQRLTAWLDAEGLPGAGAPLEHRFISGGSQNEIFELRRGDLHCAMRIPPSTAPADRDKGILREWRIIDALDGTEVPHTAAVAVCTDPTVMGRTFYLMGFVDGWSPMDLDVIDGERLWPEPFRSDLDARQDLSYALVEGAALLSKVDWKARGLEDLGRPEGYHERQVDRWTSFLERIKGRELPGFDVASEWLRNHQPIDYVPGIMHGDYQFANVMYEHGAPGRLAAIVDWEMGTVGDPKIDLAWILGSWPQAGEEPAVGYVDMRGMPTRDQVLDRYRDVSGRQVDDIDYYLVLAKWKLAIVLEQGYQRATDETPALKAFGPVVLDSMKAAADLAESTDYAR